MAVMIYQTDESNVITIEGVYPATEGLDRLFNLNVDVAIHNLDEAFREYREGV